MSAFDRSIRRDPIEALRTANLVPADRREELAAEVNATSAVSEVIARAGKEPAGICTPSRRRLLLAAAAAAGVLAAFPLLIGPAFGIGPALFSFSSADPPDQQLKTVIFSLAEGAPPGMDPGLLPDKARLITTMKIGGQQRALWAAPTSAGGMCYGWAVAGGGCDRFGTTPLDVSWGLASDRRSVAEVRGFIHSRYAGNVEIRFADGDVVRPLLVGVTEPINAAFFSYDVPQDRQNADKTVVAVVARDRAGKVVTEQSAPGSRSRQNPLADAQLDAERAELQIATRDGQATIWSAPTSYGGRCAWSEFAGERRFLAYCHPARYAFDQFQIIPVATRDDVLLTGTVAPTITNVVVRFADGAEARVAPQKGFLLYEIPTAHLAKGHEARTLLGLSPAGKEVSRLDLTAFGPCFPVMPTAATPAGCASQVIGRSD